MVEDRVLMERLRASLGGASNTASNVTQVTGTAMGDAADGMVEVDIGGGNPPITVPTTGDVRAGDSVPVQVVDGRPTATAPMGSGERTRQEIAGNYAKLNTAIEGLRGALDDKTNGFYSTEVKQEDGSSVWYLHDQPELADSQLQWKMTAGALALSTDGGKTWPYGLDVSGDAMYRYIQTHGLSADWIQTGRLSSTDGSSYIDLDSGDFVLGMGSVSGLDSALDAAKSTADSANAAAGTAQSTADAAKSAAATAQSSADAAQTKADDAWARTLRVEVMSAPADAAGDTSLLTAYAFRGGELLSDETVAKMGLLAWYVGGSRVATGSTYTCKAGTAAECRLEE